MALTARSITAMLIAIATVQVALAHSVHNSYSCNPPHTLEHGGYRPRKTHYNAGYRIQYYCDDGYEIEGYVWCSCIYNVKSRRGDFNHAPPRCRRKTRCPQLPHPEYGKVYISGDYYHGSKATYKCNKYHKIDGSSTRKCQHGEWLGKEPLCKPIKCPEVPPPKHGKVVIDGDYYHGSTATYKCDDYYKPYGPLVRKCRHGKWIGKAPICKPIRCPKIPHPKYGKVYITGDYYHDSTATYKCNDYYKIDGPPTRKCQKGKWLGKAPICKPVRCPKIPHPKYGKVYIKGNYYHDSTATYKCNRYYKIDGSSTRKCVHGKWDGKPPLCKPIKCPELPHPQYGKVYIKGDYYHDSTATYKCDDYYKLYGPLVRKCRHGKWLGKAPICKPVRCPKIPHPKYGKVYITGDYYHDSTATYKCNDYYAIEGPPTRKCQNGKWLGTAPICKPVLCPKIPHPKYGKVYIKGNYYHDSTANYKCNKYYKIDGPSTRKCQHGKWLGKAPICKPIKCPELPHPKYGKVYITGDYYHDSTATYKCDDYYKPYGPTVRKCRYGKWLGKAPICKPVRCPKLLHPRYGKVYVKGDYYHDSTATYKCNKYYKLDGSATRKCLHGKWDGKAPICKVIKCPNLDHPQYGKVYIKGEYHHGSTASYKCDKYYKLDGPHARKCRYGQWLGKAPVCKPIKCPELPHPKYGKVSVTGGYYHDSKATYECDDYYELCGPSTRLCQYGKWQGKAPICKPVRCPKIPHPKYGKVYIKGNYYHDSTATYKCNKYYEIDGPHIRKCQYGKWLGQAPLCKPVKCPEVPPPKHGKVVIDGDYHHGSTATYKCDDYYKPYGPTVRKCRYGKWLGKAPICKHVRCPKLPNLKYGEVYIVGDYFHGSTATYRCNKYYEVVGPFTRKCQYGQWLGKPPICKPVLCPELPHPKYGKVYITGDYYHGSTATYKCDKYYELCGPSTKKCQNGKWLGKAPTCKPIKCPQLPHPQYGKVDVSGDYLHGSTATYKCNDYYKLDGQETRKCYYGVWKGKAPICKPLKCPELSHPQYGKVDVSGDYLHGSTATYKCNDYYELYGQETRKCYHGVWKGKAPICKPIKCPELPHPQYGKVFVSGDYLHGSTSTYKCNDYYELDGQETRKCYHGVWKGKAPICKPIKCPELSHPQYGKVDVSGDYLHGSTATYKCNDYYELDGQETRKCYHGVWKGKAPICKPIKCPELPHPQYGKVFVSGDYLHGSTATYKCNDYYELDGQETRKCYYGVWKGKAPICKPIKCPELPHPQYGKVFVSGDFLHGSTATYKCNDYYELDGQETRKCYHGVWKGKAPICKPIKCPELPHPQYGKVFVSGDYLHGSTATYKCNDYYKLYGQETRKCYHGVWKGKAPICKPARCPLLKAPDYGMVHANGNTAGTITLYKCVAGYKLVGDPSRKCLSNGEWNGEAPTCEPVDCGHLKKPDYGYVKYKHTHYGSRAHYCCQPGYYLSGGDEYRVCQENQNWSGEAPRCIKH